MDKIAGFIKIIGGPMFSGKTSWLIHYAQQLPSESFVLYKPNIDIRYHKDECVTHNGKSFPAINLNINKIDFSHISNKVKTILIDELNLFSSNKLLKAIMLQKTLGRNIIGAGIIYDYRKKSFGSTLVLSKIADTFIQLYAKCDGCNKKAIHSYRKVAIKKQFLLGGKETYGACCDTCWDSLNQHEV